MKMNDYREITVAVPTDKLGAFYSTLGALLGGTAMVAVASAPSPASKPAAAAPVAEAPSAAATGAESASDGNGAGAASNSGEVDTGGHPWSADLHASTQGKTKDGYWRMKVGVSRPADLPGFPKGGEGNGGTGTAANGTAAQAGATAASAAATSTDDDDEFAAFRNANAGGDAGKAVERKWTDADLGALCNQAATKLGDPAPVKAIIVEMVPDGEVPHSRNIPADQREAFAQKVEAAAGITFEG